MASVDLGNILASITEAVPRASRPAVASVIAGATRPEQVIQNAAAVGYMFSAEDLAELDAIFPPPSPIALY